MRRRSVLLASTILPLARSAGAAGGPAVLELFTSQGCSSCPPADAFLGELAQRPDTIALAWHVDYWNYLGWKDPYANRSWTERQKDYARRLKGEVFTPAMVVNGAAMVVGSDRHAVAQAMRDTPVPIAATLRRTATGLEARVGSWPDSTGAMLVFYDPESATSVAAGENGGRRLKEYRIVRDALDVRLAVGTTEMPAPPAGRGAVLLIRNADGRIIAAADLPPDRSVS